MRGFSSFFGTNFLSPMMSLGGGVESEGRMPSSSCDHTQPPASGEDSAMRDAHLQDSMHTTNHLSERQQEVAEEGSSKFRRISWEEREQELSVQLNGKAAMIDQLMKCNLARDAYTHELQRTCHMHYESVFVSAQRLQGMNRHYGLLLENFIANEQKVHWLESDVKVKEKAFESANSLLQNLKTKFPTLEAHNQELTVRLDSALRDFQDLTEASDAEKQSLKSTIEVQEKALEEANSGMRELESTCRKLKVQIELIEKQAALESLESGSYSDGDANPGMLEGACKAVDKATEDLARVLHSSSNLKLFALNSPELERFVRQISQAHATEFSRPIQVKYVWVNRICVHIFQGFEHVFFVADGEKLTSPLDPKRHASECFQRFQQQKQSPSSLESLDLFQEFCMRKYRAVFPPTLVNQVFQPKRVVVCKENGRLSGDEEIFERFKDVARAVWQLHELAFSFDPPATILRMARGTPFDKQFHEPVVPVEDVHALSSQMVSFMIRPGFRVRKSIIRSRVFLCDNPNRPTDLV